MSADNYKRIGAVSTACRIMTFLSNQKEPVSGMAIAEALDMKQTTVMLQLATLADERYVEQDGNGYVLGQGVAMCWSRRKSYLDVKRDRISGQSAEL